MTKRVTAAEAKALLDAGHTYVDVRSIPEFEAGRPVGAKNLPLVHRTPGGPAPNGDFLAVALASFPKDAPLLVGCQSGGRSARAAAQLEQAGYTNVVDVTSGFAGWAAQGLPVEQGPSDYPSLLAKKP